MPVSVAIKNETGGTSGAPKNMSGTKSLTVSVTITAVGTSTDSFTDTGESPVQSETGTVASAMIAEALATSITKVHITVSLMNGASASDFVSSSTSSGGVGVTDYPVTLNIANGDARFNQICKLVPHATVTGGDTGVIAGTPLNFIKIV